MRIVWTKNGLFIGLAGLMAHQVVYYSLGALMGPETFDAHTWPRAFALFIAGGLILALAVILDRGVSTLYFLPMGVWGGLTMFAGLGTLIIPNSVSPHPPEKSATAVRATTELDAQNLGLRPLCQVSTVPAGAHVFVNGVEVGVTPLKTPLKAIEHNTVRVRLDGYASVTREFSPNAHEETSFEVQLEPRASVEVRTEPSGASVFLEGVMVLARTPGKIKELPAGKADLVFAMPGHVAQQRTVDLDPSAAPMSLEVTLSPGTSVGVASTPSEAAVHLDGVLLGFTPLEAAVPSTGVHALVVSKPNFSSVKKTIKAPRGGEQISVTLNDVELQRLHSRETRARVQYAKAEQALQRLQEEEEGPPTAAQAKLDRKLVLAERAMEVAATQLEAAEEALRLAEETRGKPDAPPDSEAER